MNKGSFVEGILGGASGGSPTFPLLAPDGTITNPSYAFASNVGTGMWVRGANQLDFNVNGLNFENVIWANGQVTFPANWSIGFNASTNDAFTSAQDAGIARVAAGVLKVSAGATGNNGWFQNTIGEAALNANYTNATAAFTNTNLSVTVTSGRTYNFELNLFISESTAADGWQLDFNGGTAAMTNFIANAASFAETGIIVALANAVSAALATVINATSTITTGGQMIKIQGSFVPSGNGTFIVRMAQNTHSTGTLTVKRGSNLIVRDSAAV